MLAGSGVLTGVHEELSGLPPGVFAPEFAANPVQAVFVPSAMCATTSALSPLSVSKLAVVTLPVTPKVNEKLETGLEKPGPSFSWKLMAPNPSTELPSGNGDAVSVLTPLKLRRVGVPAVLERLRLMMLLSPNTNPFWPVAVTEKHDVSPDPAGQLIEDMVTVP